ncbi:MAG: UDP-2,3-diacylglucosamine hydrolase [Rhizobacter sp.]|nr:UDP-2,3-diacylglucosamine hydrolase [Rhizobacter sp.]
MSEATIAMQSQAAVEQATDVLPTPPVAPVARGDFAAPANWASIEFISDLHLSAATPATLDLWASWLRKTTADAVFILGDLFEAWVGDDSRMLPVEARCVEVLAEASRRIPVYFMAGNRDFLIGPDMLSASGMQQLADPTTLVAFSRRVLLTHGDEWCLSDLPYLQFRAMVRNPAWQKQILAQPLAARQAMARMLRDGTLGGAKSATAAAPAWVDVDKPELIAQMRAADTSESIHGHTHMPQSEALSADATRHVLTDWDLDSPLQPHRAEVLRLTAAGFERVSLVGAVGSACSDDRG